MATPENEAAQVAQPEQQQAEPSFWRKLYKFMFSRTEKTYILSMTLVRSLVVALTVVSMAMLLPICIERGEASNGLVYLGVIGVSIINGIEITALRKPHYTVRLRRVLTLAFFDLAVAGIFIPGALMELAFLDMRHFNKDPEKRPGENPWRLRTNIVLLYAALMQAELFMFDLLSYFIKEDKEEDKLKVDEDKQVPVVVKGEQAV